MDLDGVHRDPLYPCWLHLKARIALGDRLGWAMEAPEQLHAHWEMGAWRSGSLSLDRDLTPQPSVLSSPPSDTGTEQGQHQQGTGPCSGPASVPLGLLVVRVEVLAFQNHPGRGWASCQNRKQVLVTCDQGAVGTSR